METNTPELLPEISMEDTPSVLPLLPEEMPVEEVIPFDDPFKLKWLERYRNNECTKEHIQRLYNIDKLTKEDFIFIVGYEPLEKEIVVTEISKLQEAISNLEIDNAELLLHLAEKDSQISMLENDIADIMVELISRGV